MYTEKGQREHLGAKGAPRVCQTTGGGRNYWQAESSP